MSERFTSIACEFELTTDTWTDLYQDVIGAVSVKSGINGNGPLDRIAGTGILKLTLLNTDNEYMPTHDNCLEGFAKNVPVRITFTYDGETVTMFYGKVVSIIPRQSGGIDYYTDVYVYDYMNKLAIHELQLPELVEDKAIEEVVALIIGNVSVKPLNMELYAGQDTFDSVFDTTKAKTKAVQEIAKAVQSELGYMYIINKLRGDSDYPGTIVVSGASLNDVNGKYNFYQLFNSRASYLLGYTGTRSLDSYMILWDGTAWVITDTATVTNDYYNSTDDVATPDLCTTWNVGTDGSGDVPSVDASTKSDEVLVVEGRYTRNGIASSATFTDEDIVIGDMDYGSHYYNHVKTIVYPRRIDDSAVGLFTLNRFISIDAGDTVKVVGRYIDPDQEAQSVSGIEMVDPVATTDYLFNTAEDGSGSDITDDLDVTAVYGTNGVEYELTNNNASAGYVTFLQSRGKGVYTYNPVEHSEESGLGIESYGRSTLNMSLPYHVNPQVGESFAYVYLGIFNLSRITIKSIIYEPNKNATLMGYFMDLAIGDKIYLDLDDITHEAEYFIQGTEVHISEHGIVGCIYNLIPASQIAIEDFWQIGEAGFGELGETTKLGY